MVIVPTPEVIVLAHGDHVARVLVEANSTSFDRALRPRLLELIAELDAMPFVVECDLPACTSPATLATYHVTAHGIGRQTMWWCSAHEPSRRRTIAIQRYRDVIDFVRWEEGSSARAYVSRVRAFVAAKGAPERVTARSAAAMFERRRAAPAI